MTAGIYQYKGWRIRVTANLTPEPLKRDGQARNAGKKFWEAWDELRTLTSNERRRYLER